MGQQSPIRPPGGYAQPKVRHDHGAPDDAWLVEDTLQKLRVIHELPIRGLGAIQAAETPDKPSVWEATGERDPAYPASSGQPRRGADDDGQGQDRRMPVRQGAFRRRR